MSRITAEEITKLWTGKREEPSHRRPPNLNSGSESLLKSGNGRAAPSARTRGVYTLSQSWDSLFQRPSDGVVGRTGFNSSVQADLADKRTSYKHICFLRNTWVRVETVRLAGNTYTLTVCWKKRNKRSVCLVVENNLKVNQGGYFHTVCINGVCDIILIKPGWKALSIAELVPPTHTGSTSFCTEKHF